MLAAWSGLGEYDGPACAGADTAPRAAASARCRAPSTRIARTSILGAVGSSALASSRAAWTRSVSAPGHSDAGRQPVHARALRRAAVSPPTQASAGGGAGGQRAVVVAQPQLGAARLGLAVEDAVGAEVVAVGSVGRRPTGWPAGPGLASASSAAS